MSLSRGLFVLTITLLFTPHAMARPLDQSRALRNIIALDPSDRPGLPSANPGIMNAAAAGTTFYGGTFWAADSQRWEAYEGQLWTFDSGVGSSIVPPGGPSGLSQPTASWVNPHKQPGLHATMEGWIGIDNTYSEITYFRRVASTDPRFTGAGKCAGSAAGLGGTYSYWCGVFPGESDVLCYVTGQGYGNNWNVCIEHDFSYGGGSVTLAFQYKNDMEDGFDFTHVYVDTTSNGDDVEVSSYTGLASGAASFSLIQGIHLPRVPKPVTFKFCVATDAYWSDQDGLSPTECGAFMVDNVTLTGAIVHSANFETSDNGWTLSPPKPGRGEWANLYHVNELPPTIFPCACAMYDSVLAFPNSNNSHSPYALNMAASPWIDLKAYGAVGATGKFIRSNLYYSHPFRNYMFLDWGAQFYPDKCLRTGKLIMSDWTFNRFGFGFPPSPTCTSVLPGAQFVVELSGYIPPGAEQVRIAVGIRSYCQFFSNCTQIPDTSPWFDMVGLGVYGNTNIPYIVCEETDRAQDSFPENGTLNLLATARVDCNTVQGDWQPEIGTTLGDTLVVTGAIGNAEVYVHFRVTPGPGTPTNQLQAWLGQHPASTQEVGFYMARMDTAEYGNSGPLQGRWMTAYHEADPNFSSTDRALDPNDVTPSGGAWRLANDIFPDDVFTAGTRLEYLFTANNVGQGSIVRDPPSGYHEMEILPSSMTSAGTWNCVLYVDHAQGRQGLIEGGLISTLGTGSANFENSNWDRFDVNAPLSHQASFGRPLQSDYGAALIQALGYRNILWDSGNLNAFNLTKEDADILLPWLTLNGLGEHNLYLSGDGVVFSPIAEAESEPSAARLVQEIAGVTIHTRCSTGTYRSANCPSIGAPQDITPCVNLDPVVGSQVANQPARTLTHLGQGNGCPQMRSFDVLSLLTPESGTVAGDEAYSSPIKSASFASVATNAPGHYKIVADGLSVAHRRDAGGPCDYLLGGTTAVAERLNEVLTYFGYASTSNPLCVDVASSVGDLPQPLPIRKPTALSRISPNPIAVGQSGHIQFTMERDAPAKIDIFNLEGRLVRSVYDGPASQGENETSWDGRDDSGAYVGNGVYFYRLRALGLDLSHKMVVVDSRN